MDAYGKLISETYRLVISNSNHIPAPLPQHARQNVRNKTSLREHDHCFALSSQCWPKLLPEQATSLCIALELHNTCNLASHLYCTASLSAESVWDPHGCGEKSNRHLPMALCKSLLINTACAPFGILLYIYPAHTLPQGARNSTGLRRAPRKCQHGGLQCKAGLFSATG